MKDLLSRRLRFDVDFALPLRIPFGLRIFFRAAFALLALATLGLALSVLVEEKQISLRNYQEGFRKNLSQIATQLRHPSGQLALLNSTTQTTTTDTQGRTTPGLSPLVLPYAAIDFDDRSKVQQAVEMSGCQVNYTGGATLCVAVGNNPWAGGFIYVAGSLLSADELVPHPVGDADLQQAHRAVVQVVMRGQTYRWLAPFETTGDVGSQSQSGAPTVRGRLTGFALDANGQTSNRPVRDFRGWLWQDSRCVQAETTRAALPCAKRWFYSIRLPIDMWRDALLASGASTASGSKVRPQWPPADLDRMGVQLQFLPPGTGPALFDSNTPGAVQPFALRDLKAQLQAGETLHISKQNAAPSGDAKAVPDLTELAVLRADATPDADVPHWLNRLIAQLPVAGDEVRSEARDVVDTPLGRYTLRMTGDGRTVDKTLSTVATRVSWFVGGMLLAIGLTWLALELRIIRRITLLSRRAATVSQTVRGADDALALDVSDLQSHDELGVLTSALADLLQRVNEDARRERIRTAQEKDQWHAVGHEIMSPLQSLKALHSAPNDASARYIHRMQQAVRVLYGSASPSEAFESTTLQSGTLDINNFLQQVATNAPAAGIALVEYTAKPVPVLVKADEHALEDAITHVLRNAERYRVPGSAIHLVLDIAPSATSPGAAGGTITDNEVHLHISNQGPHIAPDMLGKIFEYGVSEQTDSAAQGNRGQGLFVAKTYLAKMGGTIGAQNTPDGVRFTMGLQRA